MRFTIGKKLAVTFGGILSLMLLSTVLSYVKSVQMREQQTFTITVRVPSLAACKDLQRDLNQAASKARQVILAGTQPQRYATARTLSDRVWDDIAKDTRHLDELAPHWIKQENRDRLAEIERQLPEDRKIMEDNMRLAANGERDAVVHAGNEEADKATAVNDAIKKILGDLSASHEQLMQADSESLNRATNSLNLTLWITTLIALALGTIAAIFISRRISAVTRSVLDQAEAIASGDLTREELKAFIQDELGDLAGAINRVNHSFATMIAAIAENSQLVASASQQLSASSQQISANSEETSAQANVVAQSTRQVNQNLQSVSTGAEEMTSTSRLPPMRTKRRP